ncbi:hypothetical protein EHQ23_19575 [Leptospira bourretii]|uniref:Uncharacterized protein n=1 Tax=Leptospira bourretii TaxID=2484962 RepID=A0A4V3JLP2_9LEPT|nr:MULTISPECIES: hypothetical protein [Leptospira]TGK79257.1 hypothetical protein EHQ23_19575 [Leptospira bourretii]TGK94370.1 hypothetical protein EHQ26_03280 [Leptospira bourretii]TGL16793.1 hypothetical protein EHQ42_10690 [Leptospira levettii]TGL38880.1 hypothetical protein EHQ45_04750 [Leptospira bourretii]
MNIIPGSAVRFKGQNQILTVNGVHNGFCYIVWTVEGGGIHEKGVLPESLELVSEKEVEEERKRFKKIESAKVGLSIGDQFNKIGSIVIAAISIIAVVIQTDRIKELEIKIDSLSKSISEETKVEDKITKSKSNDLINKAKGLN